MSSKSPKLQWSWSAQRPVSEHECGAWWPLDQEDRTRRNGIARDFYLLRTLRQRADAQQCGQVRCFMQMVGGQRRVAVIPVGSTGQRLVTMRMRMSTVIATQGRLARPHKQRRGMPGPGHQDGESKGKNHQIGRAHV